MSNLMHARQNFCCQRQKIWRRPAYVKTLILSELSWKTKIEVSQLRNEALGLAIWCVAGVGSMRVLHRSSTAPHDSISKQARETFSLQLNWQRQSKALDLSHLANVWVSTTGRNMKNLFFIWTRLRLWWVMVDYPCLRAAHHWRIWFWCRTNAVPHRGFCASCKQLNFDHTGTEQGLSEMNFAPLTLNCFLSL